MAATRSKVSFAALQALLLGAMASAAAAADYPTRPIRLIVPFTPGGGTDIIARALGQHLSSAFGQSVVIDNRPGGNTVIASDIVAGARPDGYTLIVQINTLTALPAMAKAGQGTISLKQFAPVSLICLTPFALVAHPSIAAKDAKEFVAMVKSNPGKFTFASSGTGATAHLFAELFNAMAGLQARHVPYKGSVPAITDVMNGNVTYAVETVAATQTHIKSGKLKAFGVTTASPAGAMPDLPPLAQAAEIPGYDAAAWIGYVAPAGTPREVLQRLSSEMQKALATDELKSRLVSLGLDARSSTPEEMGAFLRKEQERYASIIKSQNIKVEQ